MNDTGPARLGGVAWSAITPARAVLGEVPIYDARESRLYWIDVFAPTLHRMRWETGLVEAWDLPSTVGSYALYEDGASALVALHDGLHELDLESSSLQMLCAAPYDLQHERFNDGRCDPQGNFWVGTIRLPASDRPDGVGHFYKYAKGILSAEIDGVTVANGIAFSPKGEVMYLADRPNGRLLTFDFDAVTSTVSGQRTFAALDADLVPDGAAIDSQGRYWVAMFGAGEVHCFLPDGQLDRVLPLPVTQPTMCAFGGSGLNTLIVTTARWSLTPDQLEQQPLAGAILAADVGATGLPEPRVRMKHRS
jgi:sugar lactone lactonase YvrE